MHINRREFKFFIVLFCIILFWFSLKPIDYSNLENDYINEVPKSFKNINISRQVVSIFIRLGFAVRPTNYAFCSSYEESLDRLSDAIVARKNEVCLAIIADETDKNLTANEYFKKLLGDTINYKCADNVYFLALVIYKYQLNSKLINVGGHTVYLLDINLTYSESEEDAKETTKFVKELAMKLDLYSDVLSDFEKIKRTHDYIVENFEYTGEDKYSLREHMILSLKNNKTGVCSAYAGLFYRLMKEAEIPVEYVLGHGKTKDSDGHAWNAVQLGGKWYFVDCTWDDPVYINGWANNFDISYTFFLKGAQTFNKTHVIAYEMNDILINYNDVTDWSEDDYIN